MKLFQDIRINGIPQIFNADLSFAKRVFFAFLVFLGVCAASFFIRETFTKYRANPIYSHTTEVMHSAETPLELPDLVIRFIFANNSNSDLASLEIFHEFWSAYQNDSTR